MHSKKLLIHSRSCHLIVYILKLVIFLKEKAVN